MCEEAERAAGGRHLASRCIATEMQLLQLEEDVRRYSDTREQLLRRFASEWHELRELTRQGASEAPATVQRIRRILENFKVRAPPPHGAVWRSVALCVA